MRRFDIPLARQAGNVRLFVLGAALLVVVGLVLYFAIGPKFFGTATVYAPLFAEIEPADGAVIRGTEAWVRWSPSVPAKGRVLWRKADESSFRTVDAREGTPLLARLGPLQPDAKYEYMVEQSAEGMTQRSSVRTFTVQAGLAFDPATVEQTVQRDYDQTVTLTLRNTAQEKITVAAKALAQFEDLPADIVGPGSADEPAQIEPGGRLDLRLAIAAADAIRESYEIPIEAAGAFAVARVRVTRPNVKLSFRVVEENPRTLAKTIEIRNEGDVLTDLAVRIAPPNELDIRLQPNAKHAYLPSRATLHFVAAPILYLEFQSLTADLEAVAAGQSARFPVKFEAPLGLHLIGVRTGSQHRSSSHDFYCTNKPTTCSELPGTEGNGPTHRVRDPKEGPPFWHPVPASKGLEFVEEAAKYDVKNGEGTNYKFGDKGVLGTDGRLHFDCSGLVTYAIKQHGCPDPADVFDPKKHAGACDAIRNNPTLPSIPESDARPGDVVFWDYGGYSKEGKKTKDGKPDHCGFVSKVENGKVTGIRHASGKGVHEADPDTEASGYKIKETDATQAKNRQFIMVGFKRMSCVPAPGPCGKEAKCEGGAR